MTCYEFIPNTKSAKFSHLLVSPRNFLFTECVAENWSLQKAGVGSNSSVTVLILYISTFTVSIPWLSIYFRVIDQ